MNFKKNLIALCLLASYAVTNVMAQDKTVVLTTFYGDKKIGGTGLGMAAEKLIDDPAFNLQPIVDKAYGMFIDEFAKDFPFKLADKTITANNQEYRSFKSAGLMDSTKGAGKFLMQFASAENMVINVAAADIGNKDNRDQCKMLKIFKDYDGVMLVNIDYEIEARMMGVAAGVTAYITIRLYNKECDRVFTVREGGKSKGKVVAVGGIPVMNPDKILPLCEDATNVLFEDLKGRLGKIVKKSSKL